MSNREKTFGDTVPTSRKRVKGKTTKRKEGKGKGGHSNLKVLSDVPVLGVPVRRR